MKIDKHNPRHWVYGGASFLCMLFGLSLRPFVRKSERPLVLLYGHKLNGNLRSLYAALVEDPGFDIVYLTLDPGYNRRLVGDGDRSVLAFTTAGIGAISRASAVVSDHGPQLMACFPMISSLKFIDVWHGIPFKGWATSEFDTLRRYDQIWVPSEMLRDIYVERFQFGLGQVLVTGYGRTDRLVTGAVDAEQIRAELGLSEKKVVLFAPTWGHGTDRSVFPFGLSSARFLALLSEIGERNDAVIVVRAHLNMNLDDELAGDSVVSVPHDRFPDTEALLMVTDVLICDWSSIAFDFLILDRPTIFIDEPAPFAHGFTLDPSFRFGAIVGDSSALQETLARYLDDPANYDRENGDRARSIKASVYGGMADGHAAERYVAALRVLLGV